VTNSSDHILQWIEAAFIVLLLTLVALLIYLTVRKIMNNKRRIRYNRRLQVLQGADSALQIYLDTGQAPRSLSITVDRHSPIIDVLRVRLAASRTELERSRIYEFTRLHFHDYYAGLLRKRRWSTRVNALLELEQFRMDSLKGELEVLLTRKRISPTEKFLILRVFASFQMKELLPYLREDNTALSDSQLLQLLLPCELPLLEIIMDEFTELPLRVQCAAVDTLRLRNYRSAPILVLLESLIDSQEDVLRLRALNAIANFGIMSSEGESKFLALISNAEKNSTWSERQSYARVMGSIREEHYIPLLHRLLGDESYQVRLTAADSLSRYKSGEEQLQNAAHHHPDRFAREMAEETLERKRYEGFFTR